jgi:hypothetical protein
MKTILGAALLAAMGAALWWYFEVDPGGSIPPGADGAPEFIGEPASAQPVTAALESAAAQHPYLAGAGINSMHNDAAQSDSYHWAGPMGRNMQVSSRRFRQPLGNCVAQTFDRQGRMIGTCVSMFGVTLVARDGVTLEVLAEQKITRWLPIGQKFSGGVYFHLDNEDRVLLASNDLAVELWSLQQRGSEYSWQRDQRLDVSALLDSVRQEQHHIIDVMPDWQGNYWLVTRTGLVAVLDRDGVSGTAISLGGNRRREGIDNALAVGKNGVFVVSDHAMYSFRRDSKGHVRQQWRESYDRGTGPKPGTMGWGSGTTPTLVGEDYVAITDNADGRVNVVVYQQREQDAGQVVCQQPVFRADRGASENSLAVVGNGLIVENNYGYSGPKNIPQSQPGLARVNILDDGKGCELAWENREITSPSAVPKVSLASGLVYVYTRDENNPADLHAWYFTAVNVHTGDVVYKQLTGVGWLFNNHYGSISIGRDGVAYVGVMGGLVKIADAEAYK